MITAKRYHDICCGHRVVGHEGKCRNLHGHNYRITFTVAPEEGISTSRNNGLDDIGRVLDFSVINTRLCQWLEENYDHRMLLWDEDPDLAALILIDPEIEVVPFNPTAENIGLHLLNVVGPQQLAGTRAKLIRVEVEETRKCSAIVEV